MRRSSSTNIIDSGISREIGTDLAKVKIVAENINAVLLAASVDLPALAEAITKATDFEGITVVAGTTASWNPATKVLTVPAVKGDKGDDGEDLSITGINYNGNGSFNWVFSDGTVYTTPDLRGKKGDKGDKGDAGDALGLVSIIPKADGSMVWSFTDGTTYTTPIMKGEKGSKGDKGDKGDTGDGVKFEGIIYQGNGRFLWKFSDGSNYYTPDLRGTRGLKGDKGDKGLQGISVHHMKGTNTTDPEGDFGTFGEKDTYTFYGDADETIVLGWFSVRNGISSLEDTEELGLMRRTTYDKDGTGVVDDSEKLGGLTPEEWEEIIDDKISEAGTVKVLADMPALLEAIKTEDDQQEPIKPFVSQFDNVIVQDGGDGYWKQFTVLAVEPSLQLLELTNGEVLRRADVTVPFNTTAQTAPSAVNEVLAELGDVTQLTANETTAVGAINKNEEDLRQVEADLGNVDTLTTSATTAVTAINELDADIGDVDDLDTAADTVVEAINELKDIADNLDSDKYNKTGGLIDGNVSISGDLSVAGSMNIVDAVTVQVEDNTIVLNSGEVGAGVTAGKSGIVVDRGSEEDYEFMYSEQTKTFQVGKSSNLQDVVTRVPETEMVNNRVTVWDSAIKSIKSALLINQEYTEAEAKVPTSAVYKLWTPRRIITLLNDWWTTNFKTKFDGIEVGATKNDTDANLKNRANHTGTQAHTTITGLGTAATRNVGSDTGNVMRVGAFGLGGGAISGTTTADDIDSVTRFYTTPQGHLGIPGTHWGLHIRHTASGYATQMEWRKDSFHFRNAEDGVWREPLIVIHSGNIRTTTGQSTTYPMTQKAVTDELNTKQATLGANSLGHIDKGVATNTYLRNDGTWGTPPNTTYTVATTSANGLMSSTDKTKLDGIADNATKNDTDVNLKNRANHTGSQAISTITGLQTALDDKQATLGANSLGLINKGTATDTYLRNDGTWAEVEGGVDVVQTTGQATDKAMSQKAVTDALNTKQATLGTNSLGFINKGTATNTYLRNDGTWAAPSSVTVTQSTGASTTSVMSQKAVTDIVQADSMSLGQGANAIGSYSTALGSGATASGYGSTALGLNTEVIGSYSTALGLGATASGDSSTALGLNTEAIGSYSTALGYQAETTGNYQIQIGRQSGINMPSAVYSAKAITVRSDQNDKSDIRDIDLGLDFIMQLRPVKFKYDYQSEYLPERPDGFFEWSEEDQEAWHEERANLLNNGLVEKDGTHKGVREQEGFLYQQVKSVADSLDTDFSGLVDATVNGGSKYANKSLAHEKFIAPMVKAIQEQQAIIESLTKRLEDLENAK